MEKPEDNYIRFMDQKPHPDEEEAMRGYFFWMEFIAETIACKVAPERMVDWSSYNWYPVRNNLSSFLNGAFNSGVPRLGWYDLAFYFATLLSDKMVLGFLDAAENGIARVRRPYDYVNFPKNYLST